MEAAPAPSARGRPFTGPRELPEHSEDDCWLRLQSSRLFCRRCAQWVCRRHEGMRECAPEDQDVWVEWSGLQRARSPVGLEWRKVDEAVRVEMENLMGEIQEHSSDEDIARHMDEVAEGLWDPEDSQAL